MNMKSICGFVISGISLSPDTDEREACAIAANELKRAGISASGVSFSVYKRSVDARKKKDIKLVYSVAARFDAPRALNIPKGKKYQISELTDDRLEIKFGAEPTKNRPLVVGMGPAGLFLRASSCREWLCADNYRPWRFNRGEKQKVRELL